MLRKEHEEAVHAAAKCREDLAKCQDELKKANEMVRCRDDSILNAEKDREHARSERDKARAKLEKAQEALCEHERGTGGDCPSKEHPQGPYGWNRTLVTHAREEVI